MLTHIYTQYIYTHIKQSKYQIIKKNLYNFKKFNLEIGKQECNAKLIQYMFVNF